MNCPKCGLINTGNLAVGLAMPQCMCHWQSPAPPRQPLTTEEHSVLQQSIKDTAELLHNGIKVEQMNNIETMKLALDALELIAAQNQGCGGTYTEAEAWRSAQSIALKNIPAIKEALAQQAEPVAWCSLCGRDMPPPRQPLTDEEISDAVREADFDWHYGWTLDDEEPNRFTKFARAIEAAVWEKQK